MIRIDDVRHAITTIIVERTNSGTDKISIRIDLRINNCILKTGEIIAYRAKHENRICITDDLFYNSAQDLVTEKLGEAWVTVHSEKTEKLKTILKLKKIAYKNRNDESVKIKCTDYIPLRQLLCSEYSSEFNDVRHFF